MHQLVVVLHQYAGLELFTSWSRYTPSLQTGTCCYFYSYNYLQCGPLQGQVPAHPPVPRDVRPRTASPPGRIGRRPAAVGRAPPPRPPAGVRPGGGLPPLPRRVGEEPLPPGREAEVSDLKFAHLTGNVSLDCGPGECKHNHHVAGKGTCVGFLILLWIVSWGMCPRDPYLNHMVLHVHLSGNVYGIVVRDNKRAAPDTVPGGRRPP
jgi:hypothetical protein